MLNSNIVLIYATAYSQIYINASKLKRHDGHLFPIITIYYTLVTVEFNFEFRLPARKISYIYIINIIIYYI